MYVRSQATGRVEMAWAIPQHGRDEVNKAGRCLIADSGTVSLMQRDVMLDVINNWRSSHSFPLQVMKMTLLKRSKSVDKKVIVAQRLKRLSSIDAKLRQHSTWMKLTQMQDIGGCRAIVRSVPQVERVVAKYKASSSKSPKKGPIFHHENDYIKSPKPDGYRGYHLVYRQRSFAKQYKVYNGLKIEIQIRTRLQHAWATAVETVSTFSGQALKSKGEDSDWRRFFALMGSAIAWRERSPIVPNTPRDRAELVRQLRELADRLNVEVVLNAWSRSLEELPSKHVKKDTVAFLLYLDPTKKVIAFTPYSKEQLVRASDEYLEKEKLIAADPIPGAQAVLVSVNSLQALRRAYPNYYLDTTVFIEALKVAIRPVKQRSDPRQGKLFP